MTAHTTTGHAAADGARVPRDWWVIAGMTTAAASAALASFAGLRGLATAAGWPARLAWLLPVTIDAYAMTSARVWLAAIPAGRPTARRFARANALGAIAASITGNAAYHAIGAGLLTVTWPVVVAVGAVPATVLGLTAHLHALRSRAAPTRSAGQDPDSAASRTGDRPGDAAPARPPAGTPTGTQDRTGDRPEDGPEPRPKDRTRNRTGSGTGNRPETGPTVGTESGTPTPARDDGRSGTGDRPRTGPQAGPSPTRTRPRAAARRRPRYRTEADLIAAAHAADARHRETHGRPITRDALRAALRISGPRATELRRLLAQPPDTPPPPAGTAPQIEPPAGNPTPSPPGPPDTPPAEAPPPPAVDPPPESGTPQHDAGQRNLGATPPTADRPPPAPLPATEPTGPHPALTAQDRKEEHQP